MREPASHAQITHGAQTSTGSGRSTPPARPARLRPRPVARHDSGTSGLVGRRHETVDCWAEKGQMWRHVVLNADGTETVLRTRTLPNVTASLSPDGSQMVYAVWTMATVRRCGHLRHRNRGGPPAPVAESRPPSVVRRRRMASDVAGGSSVLARWYEDRLHRRYARLGNGLRVMDADGSHVRDLLEATASLQTGFRFLAARVRSPGRRMARGLLSAGPVASGSSAWTAGAQEADPQRGEAELSPDGSRIAYQVRGRMSLGPLRIADADGGNVQKFTWGNSGPWNPLQPASD